MPTTRTRKARTGSGVISDRAVELYAEGRELSAIRRACVASRECCSHPECDRFRDLFFELHRELRVDTCLPNLLHPEPVFLLAVPDQAPYREQWAQLKAALEAAVEVEHG